jgi:hypothetical protein
VLALHVTPYRLPRLCRLVLLLLCLLALVAPSAKLRVQQLIRLGLGRRRLLGMGYFFERFFDRLRPGPFVFGPRGRSGLRVFGSLCHHLLLMDPN